MKNFKNINYLKSGNQRQQKAFKTVTELNIFEKLKAFNPILVGTIPIEIDLPESDLDIICECSNHTNFSKTIIKLFNKKESFNVSTYNFKEEKVTVAKFKFNNFDFEIFAQNLPTEKQDAYKHMLIEYQILNNNDSAFKEKIIALKTKGIKTEPAFAQLLQLKGDPYIELLKIEF